MELPDHALSPGWALLHTRGVDTPPFIEYVLLAEFDIDTGSTLRHQFPSAIPGYKADWFAEHMLPEGAHNRTTDYTYIFLNRQGAILDDPSPQDASDQAAPFLYGINFVNTKHDSSVRRGAIVKSICIFSRYSNVESLKQPLEAALESYFLNPSVKVLEGLYTALNSINLRDLPKPTPMELMLMRRGVCYDAVRPRPIDHHPSAWHDTVAYSEGHKLHLLNIPIYRTLDEVGNISVSTLVKVFGESTMRIFHAVLVRQRVLFVGYNHAAADIAQMVLSAAALVSPPMSGVVRRTFPYATLSDLGFTEVKGYIAGVTNPMFQQHEAWWDLLCVLDLPNGTGHVYSAEEKRVDEANGKLPNSMGSAPSSAMTTGSSKLNITAHEDAPHYAVDCKFIAGVISGNGLKLGEDWVRQQFLDYTSSILHFAQDKGTLLNPMRLHDKAKKLLEASSSRIALLEALPDFKDIPMHPWVWSRESDEPNAPEDVDFIMLKSFVRKLQLEVGQDHSNELENSFKHLERHLRSEKTLQALLTLMPESQDGLLPLAAGVFHPDPVVKLYATIILSRVQEFASTRPAFTALNPMIISGYERQKKKLSDGSLQKSVDDVLQHRKSFKLHPLTAAPAPVVEAANSALNSLSTFIQQTWTLMEAEEEENDGIRDQEVIQAFDEMDLIP